MPIEHGATLNDCATGATLPISEIGIFNLRKGEKRLENVIIWLQSSYAFFFFLFLLNFWFRFTSLLFFSNCSYFWLLGRCERKLRSNWSYGNPQSEVRKQISLLHYSDLPFLVCTRPSYLLVLLCQNPHSGFYLHVQVRQKMELRR